MSARKEKNRRGFAQLYPIINVTSHCVKKKKQILQISLYKIINPSVDKERSASIQPRSGPREFIYTYTLSHAFAPGSEIPDFRRQAIGTAGPLSSRCPEGRGIRDLCSACLRERLPRGGRQNQTITRQWSIMLWHMTYDGHSIFCCKKTKLNLSFPTAKFGGRSKVNKHDNFI